MQDTAFLLELFDFHGDLVRQFRAQLAHYLLAHQFSGKEAAAAVGDLVFREEVLALRQALSHQALQGVEVVALEGGDRHQFGVRQLFLKPGQMRDQVALLVHAVGLVHREQHRALHVLHALQHQLVLFGPAVAVDHEDHHIHILQGRRGAAVHVAVQRLVALLVQAGGVDVDRLHVALGLDAEHVVAGGLRLARGDRQFLPEDVVEQRGLAHVRAADDGDVAAAGGIDISHCRSPRRGQPGRRPRPPVRRYGGWRPGPGSCHSAG
ncbi:hypothetical protein D3C84_657810 [compost metagenome]